MQPKMLLLAFLSRIQIVSPFRSSHPFSSLRCPQSLGSVRSVHLRHLAAPHADRDGTRVFVSGIPDGITWKELKDHFKICGDVVYASVSEDRISGKSKGVGIVQYESVSHAREAIETMRNHPLFGATLFVREDVQDRTRRAQPGSLPPSRVGAKAGDWVCEGCGSLNFARRSQCFRCGLGKTATTATTVAQRESERRAPRASPPPLAAAAPAGDVFEGRTAELSAFTVPALKDLCRSAGLKVSGTKAELLQRLAQQPLPPPPLTTARATTTAPTARRESGAPPPPPVSSSASGVRAAGDFLAPWRRCVDDTCKLASSQQAADLIGGYLEKRDALRADANFQEADAIRDALEGKGIKVDDRHRVWWLQPGVPASLKAAKGEGKWVGRETWKQIHVEDEDGRGDDVANLIDTRKVRLLLAERDALRAAKDFERADEVYAQLKSMGLIINDKKRTWRRWAP